MAIQSKPIIGKNAAGKPVSLTTKNGVSKATSNLKGSNVNANVAMSTWSIVEAASISQAEDGTIVALGYGVDNKGNRANLVWKFQDGKWIVGKLANVAGIRPIGFNHFQDKWIVTYLQNVYFSENFNLDAPTVAGGLSSTEVKFTTASRLALPVDSVTVTSDKVLAASMSTVGTWSPTETIRSNGKWQLNQDMLIKTCHQETWYTFPGYTQANAQYQFSNAVPKSVNGVSMPPEIWHVDSTTKNAEGYYGIVSCNGSSYTSFVTTWTTTS